MKIDPIDLYVKLYKFSFKRKLKPLSSEDFAKLLKVSISYYYGSIHSKESLIDEGFKYFLKEIKINSDIYLTLIQKYNLKIYKKLIKVPLNSLFFENINDFKDILSSSYCAFFNELYKDKIIYDYNLNELDKNAFFRTNFDILFNSIILKSDHFLIN